jgi:hypothetical protein
MRPKIWRRNSFPERVEKTVHHAENRDFIYAKDDNDF